MLLQMGNGTALAGHDAARVQSTPPATVRSITYNLLSLLVTTPFPTAIISGTALASSSSNLSPAQIAGIAIGVIAAILAIGMAVFCCKRYSGDRLPNGSIDEPSGKTVRERKGDCVYQVF